MQEFKFGSKPAKIKIEGKVYEFDLGDAEKQDALIGAAESMRKFKPSKNGAVMKLMSDKLRGVVGIVLGQEAEDEIFAGRPHNIVEEMKLLNAIMAAREESGLDDEVRKLLASMDVETIDEER